MKKKHRDFNIFSLSALDLFCSALGVFMILCFVIFPYYGKTDDAHSDKRDAAFSVSLIWEHQFNGGISKRGVHDVDLVVQATTPEERSESTYNYRSPLPTDNEAGHLGDARRTGSETWLTPQAAPGTTYRIMAHIAAVDDINELKARNILPNEWPYVNEEHDYLSIMIFITHTDGKPEQRRVLLPIKEAVAGKTLALADVSVRNDGSLRITAISKN